MKKLPSHTTRYFAEQAWWLFHRLGKKGPWTYKTVQGVSLKVELVSHSRPVMYVMRCTYELDGKVIVKNEPVRKSWG